MWKWGPWLKLMCRNGATGGGTTHNLALIKGFPAKVFFIISMFSNLSFTPGPEFTRGLHTFNLMLKWWFCIWWLMLTRCYEVGIALWRTKTKMSTETTHCIDFVQTFLIFAVSSTSCKTKNKTPRSSAFVVQWATTINRLLSSRHCTF